MFQSSRQAKDLHIHFNTNPQSLQITLYLKKKIDLIFVIINSARFFRSMGYNLAVQYVSGPSIKQPSIFVPQAPTSKTKSPKNQN